MDIVLSLSTRKRKKFMVVIETDEMKRTIHFGGVRKNGEWYGDFTLGGNRESYIARHEKNNEDWTKKGIFTAGFWSRWLLWEKPTYRESKKFIEDRFNIQIKVEPNTFKKARELGNE
jgi:hypothetical protein